MTTTLALYSSVALFIYIFCKIKTQNNANKVALKMLTNILSLLVACRQTLFKNQLAQL